MLPTHDGSMTEAEREREIARLKETVKRFEEKGYTDTAAHIMLARLLPKPPEAVRPQNARKVKPEESSDGE